MRRFLATGLAAGLLVLAVPTPAQEQRPAGELTLRQLVGQRLVLPFPGTRLPPPLVRRIRNGEAAGVVLFRHNIRSRAHLRELMRDLQAIPRPRGMRMPLLVMIDQEGGLVKRLDGAPSRSAREMGATRKTSIARSEGRNTAANLRSVGANVDLAPVADVARAGRFMERQGRTFGRTPKGVSGMVRAFAAGLASGMVGATLKHFPGIGVVPSDQDRNANRIRLSREQLRSFDEVPFAEAIEARVPIVMLSTAVYPAFDSRAAIISPIIARTELRGRLGFRGVTVTDALDAPSLDEFGSNAKLGVRAARAGADILLYAADAAAAYRAADALVRSAEAGRISREGLERAAERVLRLRSSL